MLPGSSSAGRRTSPARPVSNRRILKFRLKPRRKTNTPLWAQLRTSENALLVGDVLETESGQLRICKYVGFEDARWFVPEPAPGTETLPLHPVATRSRSGGHLAGNDVYTRGPPGRRYRRFLREVQTRDEPCGGVAAEISRQGALPDLSQRSRLPAMSRRLRPRWIRARRHSSIRFWKT